MFCVVVLSLFPPVQMRLDCSLSTQTHTPNHYSSPPSKKNQTNNQQQLGCADDLPQKLDPSYHSRDDAFLRALHHALLEVALVEGALVCPETGRKFPVKKGIPNMLLHEDEC